MNYRQIIYFTILCGFLFLCRGMGFTVDEVDGAGAKDRVWKTSPKRVNVDENLSFIYHRDQSSELTTIQVFINGGKKAVPQNREGLAFLTTRLAIEIPVRSDVKKLMTLGSSSLTGVEGDFSILTIRCLTEKLEETLKIFTPVIKKPLFSSLRIYNIKKNMKHYRKNEEDHPETIMMQEYLNAFFGTTGYGGSKYGTTESIKKIKKKDIVAFYKKYFNLANMTISISSDLSETEITGLLKKYFLYFPAGEKRHVSPPVRSLPLSEPGERFVTKDNTQTLVSLGALLPGSSPRNFTCAFMLENILGEGMGSKLWPLRAEKNLAYHLGAKITHMNDAAILRVYLKTDNSKKEKALQALKEIMTELYREGITQEEFLATKIRSRAYFLRNNETKEARTYNMAFFESIGPGFEFLEGFFNSLDSITKEEFNSYIKEVLEPGRLLQVIVGPETPKD